MVRRVCTTIITFFLFVEFVCAYSYLPVVKAYSKDVYGAGRQNWDIGVDSKGIVYFGNNDGLLRYIFGEWELAKTLSGDVVRSLCVNNDTIWCAGEWDYGFFVKNSPGNLKYHWIGNLTTGGAWSVECDSKFVYYQTADRIIAYDKFSRKSQYIENNKSFVGLTNWDNKIWTLDRAGNLGILQGIEFKPVKKVGYILQWEIRKMFVHNGLLFILVFDGRLFKFDGNELTQVELPDVITGKAFFSGNTFDDDKLLIGTISEGLFNVDLDRNIIDAQINRTRGLLDNTVLSIGKDLNGNVWLGLDNGIAFVEMKNPIRKIFEEGATYSILDHNATTYLATNKGLFYSKGKENFKVLEGSDGQIWRLRNINNNFFVCHNKGVFLLEGIRLKPIFTDNGVMDIARFGNTPYYLLSAYSGLLLVKFQNNQFVEITNLDVWGNPKIIYDRENLCIWADAKYTDLIQLKLNERNEVIKQTFSSLKTFFKGENCFVFYDGQKLLKFEEGGFKPIKEKPFSSISGTNITALDFDKNNNFFAYVQDGQPNLLTNLQDGNFYSYQKLLSSLENSLIKGYEFIQLNNSELRVATERGVVTFNINEGSIAPIKESVISKVIVSHEGTDSTYTYPYIEEELNLDRGNKSLIFYFGTNKSSCDLVEFRYRLWPYEKDWSVWSANRLMKEYSQVKGGNYKFQLQNRLNGGDIKENIVVVNIEKHWYQTKWILVPILLLLTFVILGIVKLMHFISEVRLRREQKAHKEDLANRTINLKNEQLLQYTEIISSKNEFLNELKDGLSRMRNTDARQWENKISEEVNNEKKNFLFHKLFSELHQDFINRMTEKHENLTANDIRILSFIKINLGTKEIANLMNISPKSVDTTRYRLRKKLGLAHEDDLNKYVREL